MPLPEYTDYMKSTKLKHYYSTKKLNFDPSKREKYSKDYTYLKFLISQGMEVKKVQKLLSFKQRAWQNPYYSEKTKKQKSNRTNS